VADRDCTVDMVEGEGRGSWGLWLLPWGRIILRVLYSRNEGVMGVLVLCQ